MNKGFTSIEQSKKLLELGLDPETADMVYPAWTLNDTPTEDIVNIRRHDYENDNDVPCWSLAALFTLMPIVRDLFPRCRWCDDKCVIYYVGILRVQRSIIIDAAYEMICKLLEEGYIKKKEVASPVIQCPHYVTNGIQKICMNGRYPCDCESCGCTDKRYVEVYTSTSISK